MNFRVFAAQLLLFSAANARLIAVGDSLTDGGRTFAWTQGAWPVSPPYAEHFSNGPTWFEQFAERLEQESISLAIGGATTNSTVQAGFTGPTESWPVPGAAQQAEMWLQANTPTQDDVFIVCVSSNDFYFWLMGLADFSWTTLAEWAERGFTLTPLHSLAVRTAQSTADVADAILRAAPDDATIGVCDSYQYGKTPFVNALGPLISRPVASLLDRLTSTYNEELAARLDALRATHSGAGVVSIPFSAAMETALESDVFTNTKDACFTESGGVCEDPSTHVFWDSFHPTTAAHGQVAAALEAAVGAQLTARRGTAAASLRGSKGGVGGRRGARTLSGAS